MTPEIAQLFEVVDDYRTRRARGEVPPPLTERERKAAREQQRWQEMPEYHRLRMATWEAQWDYGARFNKAERRGILSSVYEGKMVQAIKRKYLKLTGVDLDLETIREPAAEYPGGLPVAGPPVLLKREHVRGLRQ